MKREATESFPYSRIFVGAGLCASPSNRQSQTRYLKRELVLNRLIHPTRSIQNQLSQYKRTIHFMNKGSAFFAQAF
jgi:hypothetical protein